MLTVYKKSGESLESEDRFCHRRGALLTLISLVRVRAESVPEIRVFSQGAIESRPRRITHRQCRCRVIGREHLPRVFRVGFFFFPAGVGWVEGGW